MASASYPQPSPSSYHGLRILEPFYTLLNISVDQGNFVVGQLFALACACVFRRYSETSKQSTTIRHWSCFLPGVIVCYFCFGHQISHLFVMAVLCYITMCACSPATVHQAVLFISLLYLSFLHLIRQLEEYGSYYIDITGPAMIMVQKISSLAFCLHDGMSSRRLNSEQEKLKVLRVPSLLEYSAYIFSFTNVLCGPTVYFKDYCEFIEGTNISKYQDVVDSKRLNRSLWSAVTGKLVVAFFFAGMVVLYCPKFPITKLAEDKFLYDTSYIVLIFYLMASTAGARFKYYFAWTFGEAICNAAGLGFREVDINNSPKWDLLDPVDILKFEFSTNLREALQAWNKPTQIWLRRTAYDRVSSHRTLLTYLLSAIWHGFYPGYYLTFLSGALFTQAARVARRKIRPFFLRSRLSMLIYSVITCIFTRVMMAYLVFPFVLLGFYDSIKIYKRLYFYGHVLAAIGLSILPQLF